jgi:hypothetical protein
MRGGGVLTSKQGSQGVTDLDRHMVRDTCARAFGARIDPASQQFLSEGKAAQPLAIGQLLYHVALNATWY